MPNWASAAAALLGAAGGLGQSSEDWLKRKRDADLLGYQQKRDTADDDRADVALARLGILPGTAPTTAPITVPGDGGPPAVLPSRYTQLTPKYYRDETTTPEAIGERKATESAKLAGDTRRARTRATLSLLAAKDPKIGAMLLTHNVDEMDPAVLTELAKSAFDPKPYQPATAAEAASFAGQKAGAEASARLPYENAAAVAAAKARAENRPPPPLRPVPPMAVEAATRNQATLSSIDEAIHAIQAHPNALGKKNVAGTWLTNNVFDADPHEVQTRAAVADINSLVIHDRTGAQMSVGEIKRYQPFVPQQTDTPETAVAKLQRLRGVVQQENDMLVGNYAPEQGYHGMVTAPRREATATTRTPISADQAAYLKRVKGLSDADIAQRYEVRP